MLPVILELGSIRIYSYGLMMALGFLVSGVLLKRELRRVGLSSNLGDYMVIGAALGGIFGAKVYSTIEVLIKSKEISFNEFLSGSGLVWYGGFIAGSIAVLLIIRLNRAPIMKVIDLLAPFIILGYAFGRMGCFLSGDGDYGPPTNLPWGMAFPNGTVPTWEKVHPTPVYEVILSLIIFAFLWKMRKRNTPAGWMFGTYLVLAGTERFITEFWRLTAKIAFGLSTAQFFSIVSIIVGAVIVLLSKKVLE